ncbi:MAG TPA: hypothetical protein VIE44_14220 [Methylomirabilota bacterium]
MTGLRKGRALAILWAEVPAARRPDLEAWAAGDPLAPTDPTAGVLAVGRYAGISGAPAFLEIHELLSDDATVVAVSGGLMSTTLRALERLDAVVLPGGAPGEPGGARPGSVGPAGVYGQIFPPGIDERAAVHGLPPALQIGRIDIPPAHEDEFNEWYNTEYLLGNMTVNGVYGARRYLNRGAGPRYLTVYEFAHTEVSRQPAWDRARSQSVWRRRIERLWAHAPGSPGIYRRLAAR